MTDTTLDALGESVLSGNRRALAKSITLIESTRADDKADAQNLLTTLLPHTGNSIRLGITGSPGVGKSTFIEQFGEHLTKVGKRVAVLAVDPSSPVAGGSILGDKTRMQTLAKNPSAFIRPSPAGSNLGGVARKTRESTLLCEAAGYDVVIVETVGVGQSEYEVASMVDFFLVLMLPAAGDELQGIKKGIMELAHALVINKADGESANLAKQTQGQYRSAINLLHTDAAWTPQVLTCSSLEGTGIDAVWQLVCQFVDDAKSTGTFADRRARQRTDWFQRLTGELLEVELANQPKLLDLRKALEQALLANQVTPPDAAARLLEAYREALR